MDTKTMPLRKAHHGRNVKRLREMFGIKQETIALELDITQQHLSRLEQKEEIDDDLLDKIAKVLKVPVEAIKNMADDTTYNFIANTWSSHDTSNQQFHFSPIDKIVSLYDEKMALYERMLKSEQEKVVLLEKTIEKLTGIGK